MTRWRVSGFEEIRELGAGAQGRVVLARHTERGTPVAIKYLPAGADPGARERFRHEAVMLGRVDDRHVARLYRLVEHDGELAIVMEAVNGVSFKEILGRYGTLEPEAALTVLKGSLLGLAAAHAVGVVHRDYKPANVIVPADGRSKLIDFGVATPEGTASGAGTPLYMAPEQWRGEPATPATDVYAATCVFFECLTGGRAYGGGDRASIMAGHLSGDVPVDEVPEPLRPLIAAGMAKDPAERPPGAAEFVTWLDELARDAYGTGWESKGVRALAGGAVALSALFPLAAGLVPAGAGAAGAGAATGAGSTGLIGSLGTKTATAIAGTAVVGATAGGIGVYQAFASGPDEHRAVVSASPTPSGEPLRIGPVTVRAPAAWKTHPMPNRDTSPGESTPPDSYYVATANSCDEVVERGGIAPSAYMCRGFFVLGPSFFDVPGAYIARPYRTGDSYGVLFNQDEGMSCPRHANLRAVGVEHGATRTAQRLAGIGPRKAEYNQWHVPCYTREATPDDPIGYGPTRRTRFAYTERLWHLPQSKMLVVDLWDTPNLEQILTTATWT
ncbi:serine/threonine-protein kinase [Actinomadura sp. KC345]|uniref:serine/threonine-protein kinase n=1 Tax=Actinomadura sp. KC345 TaxID=2530371 RepID=UPI001404A243|nr:serine/threonine-protein kinase [Actinomadura sp. KC345]